MRGQFRTLELGGLTTYGVPLSLHYNHRLVLQVDRLGHRVQTDPASLLLSWCRPVAWLEPVFLEQPADGREKDCLLA